MSERWEIRQLGESEFSTIERGTYARGNFQRLTPAMRYEDAELIEAELERLQDKADQLREALRRLHAAFSGPDRDSREMIQALEQALAALGDTPNE